MGSIEDDDLEGGAKEEGGGEERGWGERESERVT